MATNIVSLVMQFLTPDMIGRVATALGFDRNKIQSAIDAAVPGLLAAFNDVSTQPGGAQKLADTAKQQAGSLGNFASVLAAGGQSSVIEKGSQMLSSLVGGQNQNTLTDVISRFTGLGQSRSGSLLGMLAPIVMGTVAHHLGTTGGLDASGISNLFASQRNNIAAAMPAGLGNMLSGTGMLNSLGDAAHMATSAGSEATRAATSTARTIDQTGRRAGAAAESTASNWLYWLLPLAAAAVLIIYFAARPNEQNAPQGMNQTTSVAVSGNDIGKQLTNNIASVRTMLNGVTDVASAQAALPKLQEATAQIDQTRNQATQLSADQRKQIASLVDPMMPAFNQLCERVLAIPGVAQVLKPSVDSLKAKLTAIVA
jgi:hypothetical protein